ncbi:ribonuclease T2 family protein [Photobacterium leiognathi]|uniref:ribonuclease T2 family protein n=1 Tax=Photobacterium leiognathi TaxID=553611 RepID=UPI0029818396|nr:ribonuclease T [Photobacterium leiognathi]
MFNLINSFLVTFIFLFAQSSHAADPWEVSVKHAPSGRFDTNVVAMTWMPTFCHANNVSNNEICSNEFKLHGIWPYYLASNDHDKVLNYHPSHCYRSKGCSFSKDCKISTETISYLREDPDMQRAYPNSVALWSHEWKKHGTCSGLNQKEYFAQANTYLPKVSPHIIKLKNLIEENKLSPINVSRIYSLLPNNVSLRCKKIQDENYLFEVNFFFNRAGEPHNQVNTQIGDKCNGIVYLSWLTKKEY